MKVIIFLMVLYGLTYCVDDTSMKKRKTKIFELRQMVNSSEINNKSSGFFFIAFGVYDSEQTKKDVVKVLANVNDKYRIIEIDMKDLRIVIDNSITIPKLQIEYTMIGLYYSR